jgi:hypothetical protein
LAVPLLRKALHACRGFIGLTAYHYEVGPLVGESGVPLDGGLAHITPEAVPVKHYSAWACESHLQRRELFFCFSIGERLSADKEKKQAENTDSATRLTECPIFSGRGFLPKF